MQLCDMLQWLKEKWNVSWPRFILIFCTFALGGSLCGYAGRQLILLSGLDNNLLRIPAYILLVTVLWPFCVLLVSIPLGQFGFFTSYLKGLGTKISGKKNRMDKLIERPDMVRLAVFASGTGSNARRIIEHFKHGSSVRVSLIVCNNPKAGVLNVAAEYNLPVLMLNRQSFFESRTCLDELELHKIDWLILAGFLWRVPGYLIEAYPNRIINIHPALLPKFGGKGMYGGKVHQAVLASGEKESGITIHYVDEHYDNGDIIFQARCPVLDSDSAESLAERIHSLEHKFFPEVIESVVCNKDLPMTRVSDT